MTDPIERWFQDEHRMRQYQAVLPYNDDDAYETDSSKRPGYVESLIEQVDES
jgi:hypothetical protein